MKAPHFDAGCYFCRKAEGIDAKSLSFEDRCEWHDGYEKGKKATQPQPEAQINPWYGLISTYPNLPKDDPLRRAYESGIHDAGEHLSQPEAREDIADSCFEAAHAMPRPEALRFIASLIATHCDKSQTVTQGPQPAPKPEVREEDIATVARDLIAGATTTFRHRGKDHFLEDVNGEQCYIVTSDAITALEALLASHGQGEWKARAERAEIAQVEAAAAGQGERAHRCCDCDWYDGYEGETCENPDRATCIDHSLFTDIERAALGQSAGDGT